jgi:hypothetical protein
MYLVPFAATNTSRTALPTSILWPKPPLHSCNLQPLGGATHKGQNPVDHRTRVRYACSHIRSSRGIHSLANAMYPIRGPEATQSHSRCVAPQR